MRAEFKVNLKRTKAPYIRRDKTKFKNEPQLRQYLILAYQIKDILEKNPQRTLREISEWLGLSQILNLLFLCPKILEDVILSHKKSLFFVPEHRVREIIKEINWDKQLQMWRKLQLTLPQEPSNPEIKLR